MSSLWRPSITPYDVLCHSAKGTTWKEHKYIKKEGDTYIYPKDSDEVVQKVKEKNLNDKTTIESGVPNEAVQYFKDYIKNNGIKTGFSGEKMGEEDITSIKIAKVPNKKGLYYARIYAKDKGSHELQVSDNMLTNEKVKPYLSVTTNSNRLKLRDKQFNKSLRR